MAKQKGTLSIEEIRQKYLSIERQQARALSALMRKVKVLSPKKGDILIIPAEAGFDFRVLSEALKLTPILYSLIVPKGNAKLMDKEEAVRFAKQILKKYDRSKTTK